MSQIKWKRLWARKFSPYLAATYTQVFQTKPGFDMCKNKLFVPEGNLYAIYFAEHEFVELTKNYSNILMKEDIGTYAEYYESTFQALLAWAQDVAKRNVKEMEGDELIFLLEECARQFMDSGEMQFLSFVVLEGLGRELERLLEQFEEKDSILQWISTPYKHTVLVKARLELLEMVRDGKTSEGGIEQYVRKYAWIPMYEFIDRPWTKEDIQKQIDLIDDPTHEIEEAARQAENNLKKYKEFLNGIEDGHLKKLVDIVHHFAYLKEMRDDYRRHAYYLLVPFWKEVARRTGLTLEQTNYLLHDELIDAIRSGGSKYIDRIDKRQKQFSLILKNGQLDIVEQDISEEYLGKTESVKQNEVHGMVASPGIVRGRVNIIFHQGEFEKFQKGDILVTTMTHPEFLSIMKQSAAIVTDEGGITCHAAIIAREMKKPCVIGTKIATKVFKDGDMIEVDAESGVVRKI